MAEEQKKTEQKRPQQPKQKQQKQKKPAVKKQNPLVNVAKIFLDDQKHLLRNLIGLVVALGLVIVPAMYAWFNIAASWDPYGNTRQLKVAVANEDAGYHSDLVSIPVNVGSNVESSLRGNDSLDWQFVSRDKAVEGVRSGEYYAAIVIPKNFSTQMMTLFSPNASRATIEYYINEKSNAIAPKITEKAADTVVSQVSSTFSETIASVALDVAQSVNTFATRGDTQQYVSTTVQRLKNMADNLDAYGAQVGSYAGLLESSAGLVTSARDILSSSASGSDDVRAALQSTVTNVKTLGQAVSASSGSVSQALGAAGSSLDSVAAQIDSLASGVSAPAGQLSARVTALGSALEQGSSRYDELVTALQAVRAQVEASGADAGSGSGGLSSEARARMLSNLDSIIAQLQQVRSDVSGLGAQISAASSDAQKAQQTISAQKDDLKARVAALKADIESARSDYTTNVKPQLDALATQLRETSTRAAAAGSSVRSVLSQLSTRGSDASGRVDGVVTSMKDAQGKLSEAASSIRGLAERVSDGYATGTSALQKLTGSDRSAVELAAVLTSPVKLSRTAVYAVANYGTAMSAFYTILATWVGSVFLVSMVRVYVSDKRKAAVLGLTRGGEVFAKPETVGNAAAFGLGFGSEYWGRYLTFLFISLLQSTLIVMGDLWYLGIQHDSIPRIFLVGWVASLVFSMIMYALTFTFGAVGKAIAVIIMVMQIAGSGGTFPVELLPSFFQHVYPLLPFPYALRAMHAAIAGSYGSEYWVALGQFALFIIPALAVGLVLGRPLSQSSWLVEQLEKTDVYGE
ncbi:YhgE/Pip domain-containing protein [Alloscardovia macacae]|uniref:YhgE/Pip domain-containing protein n=1 Tax=Alloscardovia macacae TaxID=1160091 RepID=UPI0015D7FBC1|nr:YhgE/Pip domain-containing protein [Alloscardovia macacae]